MPAVSSVQRGSKTIVSADGTSVTQAIASVDTSRSIVMMTYKDSDASVRDLRDDFTVTFSAANQLTFARNNASFAASTTIEWSVVEFATGALQSLQRGSVDPAGSTTVDITLSTAINAGSAFPILMCKTGLTTARGNYPCPSFPNSTTLRLTFNTAPSAGNYPTEWQVVEFKPADASVQSGVINVSSGYTGTAAIAAVNLSKTMVAGFGNGGSGVGVNGNWQTYLSDASTVSTALEANGTAVAYNLQYFVIEMLDGTRVESGNVAIAAGATAPVTAPTWSAMTNGVMFAASPLDNSVITSATTANTQDISFAQAMNVGQDGVAISRGGTTGSASSTYYAVDWAASGGTAYTLTTASGTFVLTGIAAAIVAARRVSASVGTFTEVGNVATLAAGRYTAANQGTFTETGNAASFLYDRYLTSSPSAFSLTGNSASLLATRLVSVSSSNFSLVGNAAATLYGRYIAASPSPYTLTGNPASVTWDRFLTPSTASFVDSSNSASILYNRLVSVSPASFIFTGNAATLTYTQAGAYSLNVLPGSFAVIANNANLLADRIASITSGGFTFSGISTVLAAGRYVAANTVSFTETGNAPQLIYDRYLTASNAAFTFTGIAVALTYTPVVGVYTIDPKRVVYVASDSRYITINSNTRYVTAVSDRIITAK